MIFFLESSFSFLSSIVSSCALCASPPASDTAGQACKSNDV
jgi:hypothetical protein